MVEELMKVRVEPGEALSVTSLSVVPKGIEDSTSKPGLNENIWIPCFPFPKINTHLRAVNGLAFMSNMDISEMFLNLILHKSMQALCGVDLSLFFREVDEAGTPVKKWERWMQATMELKSSPYQVVQAMLVVKEVIEEDRWDPNNAFRWDEIHLNLSGSKEYDASICLMVIQDQSRQ
jgi:hypothetical protein